MPNNKLIPMFDMESRIRKYHKQAETSFMNVIDRSELVLGKSNGNFETTFGKYLGVKSVVGVANGTDALEIAIRSLGLPVGSKVGLTANCGGYSTVAVIQNGLVPVFCDVEMETSHPSIQSIFQLIKLGVRAIVVTHIYGLVIQDIVDIAELCKSSEVALIEDCAQSHGAKIDDKYAGSFGDIACFSFYPTKNLGALGDAGAIVTNNPDIALKMESLRTYGWSTKYDVRISGGRNSRMDEIQAEFLSQILPDLDDENRIRRRAANLYIDGIANSRIFLPHSRGQDFVAHLFVLRTEKREELISHLQKNLIGFGVHYPIPDHLQKAWAGKFEHISRLENTEKLADTVLSIPMNPYLTDIQIQRVIDTLNAF